MDHEVDIFAINLSNRIIDEIYETKVLKKEFFGKPDRSFDDCNCYRGYELILEVNVSNRLSKLICESAEHFSLSIAEIVSLLFLFTKRQLWHFRLKYYPITSI